MKLSLAGCKSTDRALEFGRLTAIVGANETGKSALTDAIRFAVLGYVPALGKRTQDTAALMRSREMRVRLQIDDLHTVERTLLQEADGGFKTKLTCSWLGKGTPQTKLDNEVLRLFGQTEQDVAEALDMRELLKVSPNQRAARIEQLLAATAVDMARILSLIAEFWWRRLASQEEMRLDDWRVVKDLVPVEQKAALKEAAGMLQETLRAGGLKAAFEWCNTQKRDYTAAVAKKRAARDELQTRLAGTSEAAAEDVQRLERRRDELQREIGAATQRATNNKGDQIKAADATVRITARQLETAQKALADREKDKPSKIRIDALRAVDHDLDALQPPQPVDDATVATLEAEAAELIQQAECIAIPAEHTDRSAALLTELGMLRANLQRAHASPWVKVRAHAARIQTLSTGTGERVKELRGIAAQLLALATPTPTRSTGSRIGSLSWNGHTQRKRTRVPPPRSIDRPRSGSGNPG